LLTKGNRKDDRDHARTLARLTEGASGISKCPNRPGERGARMAKSYGERPLELSMELREVLEPRLTAIESLNERIKEYEVRMEKIAKENYTELLKQVKGVGTQIAPTVGKTDAIRLRRPD
jgi:transposase